MKILAALLIVTLLSFIPAAKLVVTSPAFGAGQMIPSKYTCEGAELSPPLSITGIPPDAKSIAVIVHDPDAPGPGGVTHWLTWNLDTGGNIPENFKGAVQGLNSGKRPGYKGMCPPTGRHHYHFKVYALDSQLTLDTATTDKLGLENAMQGHILAEGEIIGLYEKKRQ